MGSILSWIIATFVTLPLVSYIIIFVAVKQMKKDHFLAVNWAVNGSTLFFILSVHFLIITIWDVSFLWAIIVFLILLAMTVIIVHHRIKGEIRLQKVFRGFWRLCSLTFITAYCTLVVIGLVRSFLGTF